jgi:hypothetical protein
MAGGKKVDGDYNCQDREDDGEEEEEWEAEFGIFAVGVGNVDIKEAEGVEVGVDG